MTQANPAARFYVGHMNGMRCLTNPDASGIRYFQQLNWNGPGAIAQPFTRWGAFALSSNAATTRSIAPSCGASRVSEYTTALNLHWNAGVDRAVANVLDGSLAPTYFIALYNGAASKLWLVSTLVDTGNVGAGVYNGITIGTNYIFGAPAYGKFGEAGIYPGNIETAGLLPTLDTYLVRRWGNCNVDVICDGNSLTYGYPLYPTDPSASYPEQLSQLLGKPFGVSNYGVNAQTTPMMQADYATQIAPLLNPARTMCVYVPWEIGNDLYYNGATYGSYLPAITNYYNLCDAAQATGFKVVACTVPLRNSLTGANESIASSATRTCGRTGRHTRTFSATSPRFRPSRTPRIRCTTSPTAPTTPTWGTASSLPPYRPRSCRCSPPLTETVLRYSRGRPATVTFGSALGMGLAAGVVAYVKRWRAQEPRRQRTRARAPEDRGRAGEAGFPSLERRVTALEDAIVRCVSDEDFRQAPSGPQPRTSSASPKTRTGRSGRWRATSASLRRHHREGGAPGALSAIIEGEEAMIADAVANLPQS